MSGPSHTSSGSGNAGSSHTSSGSGNAGSSHTSSGSQNAGQSHTSSTSRHDDNMSKGAKLEDKVSKQPLFSVASEQASKPPSKLVLGKKTTPEAIDISNDLPDLQPDPNIWLSISRFDLYYCDKEVVKSGKWLNDSTSSQNLIEAQCSCRVIIGFQNTQLSKHKVLNPCNSPHLYNFSMWESAIG